MNSIEIIQPTGGMIVVKNDEHRFEIHHDAKTGDWSVMDTTKKFSQQQWMLTKDDAVNYVLLKMDVLENPDYELAPDRTSA